MGGRLLKLVSLCFCACLFAFVFVLYAFPLEKERESPPKWDGGGVMLTFLELAHMEIPSVLQLILENSEIWYGPRRRFLENKGFLDVK